MEKQIISAVLVPKEEHIEAFRIVSSRLKKSLFQLDNDHIPHLTIAQFFASHDEVHDLAQDLNEVNNAKFLIKTNGINFYPDFKRDETWVEILAQKTKQIRELQRLVLSSEFAQNHSIHSGVEDEFRPHVTIGLLPFVGNFPSIEYGDMEIINKTIETELRIGKNGEYFTFKG